MATAIERLPVEFKTHVTGNLKVHPPADSGQDIHMTERRAEEVPVHLLDVRGHPDIALIVGLASMPETGDGPSVIGGDDNEPVLLVFLLPHLHSLPHLREQTVGLHHIAVGESTIAMQVEGIVRIPEIKPAEVGRVVSDTFGSIGSNLYVVVQHLQLVGLFGKTSLIEVVAVEYIVDLKIPSLGLSSPKQNSPVVSPATKKGCRDGTMLVFCDTEDVPVIVVYLNITVIPDIVLVDPRPSKDIGVANGRDCGSLIIHITLSTAKSAAEMPLTCYRHNSGGLESPDAVGRNTIQNYEQRLALACCQLPRHHKKQQGKKKRQTFSHVMEFRFTNYFLMAARTKNHRCMATVVTSP